MKRIPQGQGAFSLWGTLGLVVLVGIIAAIAWPRPPLRPGVAWQAFSSAALAEAKQVGRPVVLEVYAAWCGPCQALEASTFRYPPVVQAMYGVLPLRIDMTEGTPPEAVALLAAAGVMGVPTVLFFDSAGNEVQALRLDGFEPGEDFLKRLSALLIDPPR